MDTPETSIKLPLKFTMNMSYVIWGIIGMVMSVWFAVIAIVGDNVRTKSDRYSGIALVVMFAFCGIKLFIDGYKLRILATENELTAKRISGELSSIYWKDIDTITLEKSPAGIVVRSVYQTIVIPLKLKKWELLLGILEEKVAAEKFIGFD